MGGPGSGTWYRSDKKDHVRSRPYVDIRFLNQQECLFSGAQYQLTWKGEQDGSCMSALCRVIGDGLVIEYEYLDANGDQHTYQNVIDFDFTPCNFGGRRTWLTCPSCQQRVAVVYRSQLGFSCRRCCDLTYLSKRDHQLHRLIQKAKLIHVKVGGTGDITCQFPSKPKGMHWRTYWRLLGQETELWNLIWGQLKSKYAW